MVEACVAWQGEETFPLGGQRQAALARSLGEAPHPSPLQTLISLQ